VGRISRESRARSTGDLPEIVSRVEDQHRLLDGREARRERIAKYSRSRTCMSRRTRREKGVYDLLLNLFRRPTNRSGRLGIRPLGGRLLVVHVAAFSLVANSLPVSSQMRSINLKLRRRLVQSFKRRALLIIKQGDAGENEPTDSIRMSDR